MLSQQRLTSLDKFLLKSLACFQLCHRLNEPSCVLGASEKVGSFFKRLVVFHRHHYNGTFPFACYRNGRMIVADLLHFFGKVAAGSGITYAFHDFNLYMYGNMYEFYQRITSKATGRLRRRFLWRYRDSRRVPSREI